MGLKQCHAPDDGAIGHFARDANRQTAIAHFHSDLISIKFLPQSDKRVERRGCRHAPLEVRHRYGDYSPPGY
jgi:hypothetical protein